MTIRDEIAKIWNEEGSAWQRVKKFYKNETLTTRIGMYLSIVISLFFILVNCWNGFHNDAVWPILLAGYYILIDAINGMLLMSFQKKYSARKERTIIRSSGYLMLGLDFLFLVMLSLMIMNDIRESYNIIIIVANSIYTAYRIVVAIINMVRCRQMDSPTMIAVKHINMIAALITATILQASVVAWLGGNLEQIRIINGIVGVTVFVIIFIMSSILIHNHMEN